jgi:RecA-family ATPase
VDHENVIPVLQVILFYANGGTGKSVLMIMLAVARCIGADWLGWKVKPGRTLLASGEDDKKEIRQRVADIAKAEGWNILDMKDFAWIDWTAKDCVIAIANGKTMKLTKMYDQLLRKITKFKQDIVILDTKARCPVPMYDHRIKCHRQRGTWARYFTGARDGGGPSNDTP